MDIDTHASQSEILDGLVQFRYVDEDEQSQDIDAHSIAEVLQGVVDFSADMDKAGLFGHGLPPQVRIRPPREGSFILEAVFSWAADNPEAAVGAAMTAGGGIVQTINLGIKRLRGQEPKDFEPLANGDVKINWPNGTVDQVPNEVWTRLRDMKRPTRKALKQLMAPLQEDKDVLEIRDGRAQNSTPEILETDPDIVLGREDYRIAAMESDEPEVVDSIFETEAKLRSVEFSPGPKWRISTPEGTRRVTMGDEDFLRDLDKGLALRKGDTFDVKIREVSTTHRERTTRDWTIIEVIRIRPGGQDDDDDGSLTFKPSE